MPSVAGSESVSGADKSDLGGLARSSTLNLVGGISTALLTVALTLALTRGLPEGVAGVVFSVVALFQVLMAVAGLGVETGLVRYLTARPTGSVAPGGLFRVALIPVGGFSALIAVSLFMLASRIGVVVGGEAYGVETAAAIRAVAFFIPAAALAAGVLGATRGYGTMVPTVILDRVTRPLLQVVVVVLAVARDAQLAHIAGLWASTFVLEALVASWWLRRLSSRGGNGLDTTQGEVALSFWRFTLPRAVATSSRVMLQWLDIVLVSALASPEEAATYAVATRIVQFGMLAAFSVGQAVEPLFGTAIGSADHQRTRRLYQVATAWLILLTWPFYILVAIYAPAILEVFGAGFGQASDAVLILVVSVLLGAAVGPADFLLVMAGRSSLSLWNTLVALGANVALNLWLTPRFGLVGAAVSWSVSRIVANLLPLLQLRRLSLQPFGSGWMIAAGMSLGVFGVIGVAGREVFGEALAGALVVGIIAAAVFVLLLHRFRVPLALDLALDSIRRRKR